jgi:hypothetical protein
MASRKVEHLTLEQIREGDPGLTQADLIRASQGLLAALRRNANTIQAGRTPGTARATFMQRTEGKAFWSRKEDR